MCTVQALVVCRFGSCLFDAATTLHHFDVVDVTKGNATQFRHFNLNCYQNNISIVFNAHIQTHPYESFVHQMSIQ